MELSPSLAAAFAIEASASLSTFRKIGYHASESLLCRAKDLESRERIQIIARQQLGLSAMSVAVREAAQNESNEALRKLLLAATDTLEALCSIDDIQAVRIVGARESGSLPNGMTREQILSAVREAMRYARVRNG